MRRIILGLFVVLFALSVTFLLSGVVRKMNTKNHLKEKIATLPTFSFITLANETFNSSEIEKGPVLIVRFHPECEHCQYEVSEIMNSTIPSLAAKVILVSSAPSDSVRKFLTHFNYSDYPAIIPLLDTSYTFGEIFGSDMVPSNYIYNKELKLVKVLPGEVKTETIIKYLRLSE